MAPKRSHARDSTPSSTTKAHSASTPSGTSTPSSSRSGAAAPASDVAAAALSPASKSSSSSGGKHNSSSSSGHQSPQDVALGAWKSYLDTTPQRTKLIDVFMAFLVVVGGLQFVYCVLVGNYPFNAFLSGFSATVGQFVLTASLRIQTNPLNKADFYQMSPERAFADYVFGSLILHLFCVNFIN